LPGEGNDPSDPLAQEEYGCIDNDPAVNDWILTIADASEPGSHRLHCKTHVPLRLINSDGGSITCRGTARVLQGNAATIGKPGGFSGPSAGTIPVTAEGAAIIVSQWGMSKSQLRPFLSDISGVFPNVNASFVGVVDIVGGTPPPGFTNVQTALMTLYPGQLIIELPGAPKDYGVTAVIIAVPTVVGCPKGTVQVPR